MWQRGLQVALVVALLAASALLSPIGQPSHLRAEELEEQIARIQQEVSELEAKVFQIKARRATIEGELRTFEAKLEQLKQEGRTKEEALLKAAEEREQTRRLLSEARQELSRIDILLRKRLRAFSMYHATRTDGLWALGSRADRAVNDGRATYLFQRVRQHDLALVAERLQAEVRAEERGRALEQAIQRAEGARDALRANQAELQAQIRVRVELRSSLNKEREQLDSTLTGLRAQALRLEAVLVTLTGSQKRQTGAPSPEPVGGVPLKSFVGPGLEGRKGALPAPIVGRLLAPNERVPGAQAAAFQFLSQQRGVWFEAETTTVKAVAAGAVAFVGSLPGIGRVVILDHGARWYTVYGGLRDLSVTRGAQVAELAELAHLDGSSPHYLYFEVRKGGKPVDPRPLLATRPRRSP